MNPSKMDRLRTQLAESHARGQAHQAELAAARDRPAAPGDAYLWSPADEHVLAWVVVCPHPTDADVVYVVPADAHPLAGIADVAVRDVGAAALFLRCGRGHWIARADLDPRRRFRTLDAHHVRRAQQKLRQIVTGPLDGSSAAREHEADPGYRDWMAGVTASVLGAVGKSRRGPGVAERLMTRGGEPSGALADLDSLLAELGPAEEGEPLPFDSPGRLAAVREVTGVALVFEPDAGSPSDPPAVVATDATGAWRALAWDVAPDGTARATAPWLGGRVRLRVGTGPAAREHTLTNS